MLDLATESGKAVLDVTSYPVFVLGESGRILDVNEGACRYFKQTREQLLGVDSLGMRGYSPTRRAEFARRFAAWLQGEQAPFRIAWPPRTGADEFLVLPSRVSLRGKGVIAVQLIPVGAVEAALERPSDGGARRLRPARGSNALSTVPPTDGSDLEKLTPREWEIARRLAEGDRVPLIVEDLGIAENTVRNHLKSIFKKLHVRSQADLIRALRRRFARAAS